MTAMLEVLDPGVMTTIQDRGRFGSQALGISVSGALDIENLEIANSLVGNQGDCGAFEIRMLGPTFRVRTDSVKVALAGTSGVIELLGSAAAPSHPAHQSLTLTNGQEFRVGAITDSAVCYLAVAGGLDVPHVYGSQSTYLPGGFGGFQGRRLQAGDEIPLCHSSADLNRQRVLPTHTQSFASPPAHTYAKMHKTPTNAVNAVEIRAIAGPQDEYFSASGLETFWTTPYRIDQKLNRMGIQLEGHKIAHLKGYNIASDGIVSGAIQVPGHGLPIILLSDCQTTGGYPKIATVISADRPLLGRLMPETTVTFREVSVQDAETLAQQRRVELDALVSSIFEVQNTAQPLETLLMSENLISGVTNRDQS